MVKIKNRVPNSKIFIFPVNVTEPYHSELEKAGLSAGFQLIDGLAETIKVYEQQGFTTRAADKDHWNELGHKIAAEKIYDYLVGQGYVNTGVTQPSMPVN